MATITGPTVQISRGVATITWASLGNGDQGNAFTAPYLNDASVQVTGTFGAGGTVVIEGSLDGTNFVTLTDPQGNQISFTAAALEAVQEMVRYVRPRVTAGDGTTDLTVTLVARGSMG